MNTVDHTKMYSEDVKKFLRRVEVKAFFHRKRMMLTNLTKIRPKHFRFESLRGLPWRASSHIFSLFIKECRQNMFKLKFNCSTKFWNLSPEEWSALKILKETQIQYYSPAVIDQKNTELFKLMIKA